jgi:hypothetical protein
MARTGKAMSTATVEALALLKEQFDQWRAARRKGEKIPPKMWEAAIRATSEHGVYRVSRALKLDYAALKQRAAESDGSAGRPTPRFVELAVPHGLPVLTQGPEPQCVVEMSNAHGATMRVQLHGPALASLPALCQAFWTAS